MTTGIDYLDEVWNPTSGCSGKNCPVRDTCWARGMVKRFPWIHDPNGGRGYTDIPFDKPIFHPDRLDKPLHWRKPWRIGVCFMGDLFDEQVYFEWFEKIMNTMANAQNAHHNFFVLTKQVRQMDFMITRWICKIYPSRNDKELFPLISNIHWGITVTSQSDADRMIPELLRIPGKHWLSIEPLLEGPIRNAKWAIVKCPKCNDGERWTNVTKSWTCFKCGAMQTIISKIGWVTVGCHNNPRRYPCKIEWIESIVEQCKAANVPVWVKQIPINGKVCRDINKFPASLRVREVEI